MNLFDQKLGRRRFISATSMAIGAGMLLKPSQMVFGAQETTMMQIPGGSEPRMLRPSGTKYGHNIILAPEKIEDNSMGTPIIQSGMNPFPEAGMNIMAQGRMVPSMMPYPTHSVPEKHDEKQEVICMIGNNPDDPLDLGAEVEFYMGKGPLLEKHPMLTRTTIVHMPTGQWHWPWRVHKITRAFNWVIINIPTRGQPGAAATQGAVPSMGQGLPSGAGFQGGPQGAGGQGIPSGGAPGIGGAIRVMKPGESLGEEMEKAKTDPKTYRFNHLILSGVDKSRKDPKGGKWIAYMDSTIIAEAPLLRVLRYRPEEAPYPIIGEQTHEYESFYCFYGLETYDPDLGAEIDLYIGPEKEKHTINLSAQVYIPAKTAHGPFIVKKAKKPFNLIEVVGGAEQPGAVYNNELVYEKYKQYL